MSKSPNCQQCEIVNHVKLSNCHNVKFSNCQSNFQIVTISNVMYYQSVQINLAHRLCTDFQYFFEPKPKLQAKGPCHLPIRQLSDLIYNSARRQKYRRRSEIMAILVGCQTRKVLEVKSLILSYSEDGPGLCAPSAADHEFDEII